MPKQKKKSLRLLHTADWHLGKRLNQFNRIDEQRAVLAEICDIAEAENVDAVLIAGDIFDSANPSHEAEDLLYQTLARLSDGGNRAVIAIAGNHDAPGKIENPDPLARASGIIFAGYPDSEVRHFSLEKSGLALTASAPGFIELQLPGSDVPLRILLTPYANAIRFKQALRGESADLSINELLKNSWANTAEKYCDSNGVNLLLAHLFMMREGGEKPEEPDDEKSVLHIGGADVVFAENVPPQIQYVALGHLHRRQTIATSPCPVVYSSSPLAYSMSEANQQKYVVLIDAEQGKPVAIRDIPLTGGRKLLRQSFETVDAAVEWLTQHSDAIVEITMITDTFLTTEQLQQLRQSHDFILGIVPRVKNAAQSGANDEPADPMQDVETLFVQFFKSQNDDLDPNDELLSLFREVIGRESATQEDGE